MSEVRQFQERSLRDLRRAATFGSYAFVLTDPVTSVGSSPLAEVPCLADLPRLIRLKYLTTVNRWTTLGDQFVSLHAATDGDLSQSLLWSDLLRDYDVVDVASAVLRDRYGCWGFVDLWRRSPHPPFSPADLTRLSAHLPAMTEGVRRGQAAAFSTFEDLSPPVEGPVVLLLSPELEPLGETAPVLAYLAALLPPAANQAPIPASAYNVAAQLIAREAGVDDQPVLARVSIGGGRWLALRAARLDRASATDASPIAVTIEAASTSDRLELFARANALSDRETELLRHLDAGLDTHAIAAHMYLSEYTVQDHAKAIFAKTGIRTRRALLSRVRG